MRTNVLHIVDSLGAGGAETIAVNTCNTLNKGKSVKAYLCATRFEGALKDNIDELSNYIFINKKRAVDVKALSKLFGFIKKNHITILHAHTTSFFIAVLVKLRFPKIKLIWHNHTGANIDLSGWRKMFLKSCSFFFSTVINVNEELNIWTEKTLFSKRNFTLNNFATFTNRDYFTELKGNANKKIVCVAGLRPEKDHPNLLKAFLLLLNEFSDVSIHLVGKDYNNQYSSGIKEFIIDNNLKENVFLYDNCSDIHNVLNQASIGVLSSKSEGLPISLLEYGLAKLPVVVTDVGDCSKLVTHNKSGRVVIKENPVDFSKSLLFLLKNEEKSFKFGAQLKMNVDEKYSLTSYIKKLTNIYSIH